MPKRKIVECKSFVNSVDKYFLFKSKNFENLSHARSKFIFIYQEIARISELKSYPGKLVKYSNSKELQYFVFQKHLILFKLDKKNMYLKYFVAEKRIKKPL